MSIPSAIGVCVCGGGGGCLTELEGRCPLPKLSPLPVGAGEVPGRTRICAPGAPSKILTWNTIGGKFYCNPQPQVLYDHYNLQLYHVNDLLHIIFITVIRIRATDSNER